MPEDQFYICTVGSILDYTLIGNLARQFRVSKLLIVKIVVSKSRDSFVAISAVSGQSSEAQVLEP